MKKTIILALAMMMLCAAHAEIDLQIIDSPQTMEQQILYDLSASQSDRVISAMLVTRETEMSLTHDAGCIDDALYDFIISAENSLPEPVSVILMIPTDRFGKDGVLAEMGVSDAGILSTWGLTLPLSINYSANLQRDQALYLESKAVVEPVRAWTGGGVAFVLRYYGEALPQFITALPLSRDSEIAVAKTTMVYFHQIGERGDEVLRKACAWFGQDAFSMVSIKKGAQRVSSGR